MSSNDSKIEKVQKQFKTLSSVAAALNDASDQLTAVVATLDESLKKLNIGLTVWVTFRSRSTDIEDAGTYDDDQIGYCKVSGTWGIALRNIWGNPNWAQHDSEGPWLFNDAPRDLRLNGVDKIPELIEALSREAFSTAQKIEEKAQKVGELASAIDQIAKDEKQGTSAVLPPNRKTHAPSVPFKPAPNEKGGIIASLVNGKEGGK